MFAEVMPSAPNTEMLATEVQSTAKRSHVHMQPPHVSVGVQEECPLDKDCILPASVKPLKQGFQHTNFA